MRVDIEPHIPQEPEREKQAAADGDRDGASDGDTVEDETTPSAFCDGKSRARPYSVSNRWRARPYPVTVSNRWTRARRRHLLLFRNSASRATVQQAHSTSCLFRPEAEGGTSDYCASSLSGAPGAGQYIWSAHGRTGRRTGQQAYQFSSCVIYFTKQLNY